MPRRRRSPSDSRSDSRRRGGGGGGRGRSRSGGRGRGRSRGSPRGGRGQLENYGNKGKIVEKKPSGFGFIRPESGQVDGNDLYFHCSACNTAFDQLERDDLVTYTVGRDERNGRAIAKDVRALDEGGSKRGGGGGRGRDRDSRSPSRRR
eukprot:TRINITY_DN30203_c0_g1_i1.p1 TRINITY_DN30203_c0_g1~~TRINITY_DN30203_c0_g1_i1.p1  ORF type:complete len:149 (-),score=16.35 TRINITY_DN30203_c0_g1_i1:271-717(-)